jgi:predicted SnoaL-like aldol condensation-catalyzing enzyme
MTATTTGVSHKDAAVSFLRLVASGKVREAYQKYVAPNLRHHNPFFRGDATSLTIAMDENAAKNPNKVLEIQRALEDGDLVAVHTRVRQKPGELGAAAVHIFKFQGDRVVELWDVGQPAPENSPNENSMF